MSGHSKWSTIKHKKGAADAKRGKLFTKIIKEIIVAARDGGGDPDSNPRLRTALLKARGANMPKDNIERAVKKGTGDLEGIQYVQITYEAYAPGGVALLIDCLTDNKNRTAADVRNTLAKWGGSLGQSGSVAYQFKRKGLIALEAGSHSEDEVLDVALEAGAEDVVGDQEVIEVTTEPEEFEAVLAAVDNKGWEHSVAEISMIPDNTVTLDHNQTRKVLRLVESLEDCDDVQSVSSNLDIPEDFSFDE
jgi:YebC/PmpR family DNA-binding regulatory protein